MEYFYIKKNEKEFGKHPTQKPFSLLKRIIIASTNINDIILDPFSGSSTTGVAVLSVGDRCFIGAEIDPLYCEISKKRFEKIISGKKIYFAFKEEKV